MTIAPDARAVSWGHRRQPIPKGLAYVYSFDFVVILDVGARWYLRTNDAPDQKDRGESYHVFGDTSVMVGDGVRRDVPIGTVKDVHAELLDPANTDAGRLEGRVVLDTDTGPIVAALCGVVNINGGIDYITRAIGLRAAPIAIGQLAPIAGSSFVSLTHETAGARYRWMDRCQLFGVGRVEEKTRRDAALEDGLIRLGFSFDIYFAR
jgi:hypothetical protein